MKEELQKYGVVADKKVSPEKFYEIICSYQGKKDNPPFESYSCTLLDDNNIITFVSPNTIILVHGHPPDDSYYNTLLNIEEAFKLLNPYLRKSKIKKLKNNI